jgi:putative DNA primase/helicase
MDFNTIARGGAKDGSRATPDLARLIGIRFALANEPEKGVCINEALLKQLTGGDDITARPLYGDLIEFKPVFKLFVTANSKPTVSDDSLFSSGRIKLLPFTRHFSEEEQDTNLKSRFRTEQA